MNSNICIISYYGPKDQIKLASDSLKNTGLNGYVLSDPLVNYYSGHESLSNNYSQYWSSYELFYNSIWENLKFAHKFYYYYNKRVVKLKILMESCFDKT